MKKYSRTSLLQSLITKFLCFYFSKMWFFFNLLFLQPWYKGAIMFFWIRGPWKSWGSQNFFKRNRGGVTKKNQEIIGWLQILFNEIAPKCIFSALCASGATYLFNVVAPGGGVIKFLIIKWGGGTKILLRYFGKFMTPPIPKKMVAP